MSHDPDTPPSSDEPPPELMTTREGYNVVTDTVSGPNIRLKDNLFQLLAIFVCVLIGAGIGSLFCEDWRGGVMAGAFIGLIVGLFGSGIFLMIYRAVKHFKGQHK